ncbi:MAG: NeuD/PglB/VioB family sugar acetyltransferase [Magnetospiraceae bacterium]
MTIHLLIVGAGAFGREVAAYAADLGPEIQVTGFLDDTIPEATRVDGLPVRGTIAGYQPHDAERLILGIGDAAARVSLAADLTARGAKFASVVHSLAWVAPDAVIGNGVLVAPFATIGPGAQIGDHGLINTHVGVGHDCRIGRGAVLCPHACLNGNVVCGQGVFVGSGAVVTPTCQLADHCQVAAGAVVYTAVPEGHLATGNPARARRVAR